MKKGLLDQVLKVVYRVDVHKNNIEATISMSGEIYETKEFNSITSSLTELRDWCKSKRKPFYNILEEGISEIILVNARHIRNVSGHKTDKNKVGRMSMKLTLNRISTNRCHKS